MLFVALLTPVGGTALERATKRLEWQYPPGVTPVAEYWLHTNEPQVISIVEADSAATILALTMPWADMYDITVTPAITAEDGLALLKQMTGS